MVEKRFICDGCFGNFPKGDKAKKFCSDHCKLKQKVKKCIPACSTSDQIYVWVGFKDQGKHARIYCSKCRKHTGVPRDYFQNNPYINEVLDCSDKVYSTKPNGPTQLNYNQIEKHIPLFTSELIDKKTTKIENQKKSIAKHLETINQHKEIFKLLGVDPKRFMLNKQRKTEFVFSREFREARYLCMHENKKKHSGKITCEECFNQTGPFQVDHILPKSKYPKLYLDQKNLRVLCADCNIGKGNKVY